ncbi:MAG: hypothetical protein Kow0090_21150 [Myxococcota bacterium]
MKRSFLFAALAGFGVVAGWFGCGSGAAPGDDAQQSCNINALCEPGKICIGSFCAPAENYQELKIGDKVPCKDASHCPANYECSNSICRKPCKRESDCQSGGSCVSGYCLPSYSESDDDDNDSDVSPQDDDDDANSDKCAKNTDCDLPNSFAVCENGKCVVESCDKGWMNRDKFDYNGCEFYCGDSTEPPCGSGGDDDANGCNECSEDGLAECIDDKTFHRCYTSPEGCLLWSENEDCPADTVCADGFCVGNNGCENECDKISRRECVSDTEYHSCIVVEGCLKWEAAVKCDYYCKDGNCVKCLDNSHCDKGKICTAENVCVESDCTPNCGSKECGSDGCGGNCGECPQNGWCDKGVCRCLYDNGNFCGDICCTSGKTCKESECCPDRFHNGCDYEGQKECESTALPVRHRVCKNDADGCPQWEAFENCKPGEVCRGEGICGKDECTKGEKKCDGNKVVYCEDGNNDGFVEWVVKQTCTYFCQGGVCGGCSNNSECQSPTPICDTSVKLCVGCLNDSHCSSPTGKCLLSKKECVECLADPDCPAGKKCDTLQNKCVCAYEVCLGVCCTQGQVCYQGACYTPQCGTKECGTDAGGYLCGICPENAECGADGKCKCTFDACDSSCCPAGQVCYQSACYTPQCGTYECGPDANGYICGTCGTGESCINHTCQCDNTVCLGVCCEAGQLCHKTSGNCCNQYCPPPQPNKYPCGDDGCGFSCGDCPGGYCDITIHYCKCNDGRFPCYDDGCCKSNEYCDTQRKECRRSY